MDTLIFLFKQHQGNPTERVYVTPDLQAAKRFRRKFDGIIEKYPLDLWAIVIK